LVHAAAAQASHLVGFPTAIPAPAWFTDVQMQAAFQALLLLNPRLTLAGFGSVVDDTLAFPAAACLDVWRGVDYTATPTYPVYWPPVDGTEIALKAYHGNAIPDPLAHCDYTAPSGPPVILMLGDAGGVPTVTTSRFLREGEPLNHCVFTAHTYTHPNHAHQTLGRDLLGLFNAVVVIPESPLAPANPGPLVLETTFEVQLTVDGQEYAWSFGTGPDTVLAPAAEVR